MWISDKWKDYRLLDCGRGEKLERWGDYTLVRPDPQAIWNTPRTDPAWRHPSARYARSSSGGGRSQRNGTAYKFSVKGHNFAAALAYVHFSSLPTLFSGYTIYSSSISAKSQHIVCFSTKADTYTGAWPTFCPSVPSIAGNLSHCADVFPATQKGPGQTPGWHKKTAVLP